jgi:hypothetical protein
MLIHPPMLNHKRACASFDRIGRKVMAVAVHTAHCNKTFAG